MTIRFLTGWNGFYEGQTATLANEAALISAGIATAVESLGLEWKYLAGDLPNWTKGAEWTNSYPISTGEIARSLGLHMRMDG